MVITAENVLLIGSVILFVGIIFGKIGYRFGMPVLLLFLAVGMLFGSDGLGIQFDNSSTVQFIGIMALSIILFSGGMDTRFSEIKPVLGPGIVLSTIGVLMTTLLTGGFIYFITSAVSGSIYLTLAESMLLAAVMSSTDSASVFSILRSKGLSLKENIRPVLELESGSNDPMAYMLTIILIDVVLEGRFNAADSCLELFVQFSVGAVFGYGLGRFVRFFINRINLDNNAFYSILLLAFIFFIFSITDLCNGNGYLSVYIAGLVVGNGKLLHKRSLMTFFDGFTWLWQIVMFITLGLLVNPHELVPVIGTGLLIAVFMILFARPVSVFVGMLPFRNFSVKAKAYISWVGLKGAVPIIFATYPLIAGVENARVIFNVVFFMTIVSLLVQGTTVGYMAKLLKLIDKPEKLNAFDIDLPDEIKAAMSEMELNDSSLAHGNRLMDLDLPDNTLVVMVKRMNNYFVPKGHTKLHAGDILLVISDNEKEMKQACDKLGVTDYSVKQNF